MLITFSGVDCAGKTTQIDLLRARLEARGLRVMDYWYRPGYSKELDALRRWVRRFRPGSLPQPGRSATRDAVFARPGVSQAWIMAALGDMLLQYAAKLRVLQATYDVVICDRYFEDAALDFALRFPDASIPSSAWFRAIRRLSPKPDLSVLLTLPHAEMLRRMAIKDEPFPDSDQLRDKRFTAYQQLAQTGRFHVIDASRSIAEVHDEIWQAVQTLSSDVRA